MFLPVAFAIEHVYLSQLDDTQEARLSRDFRNVSDLSGILALDDQDSVADSKVGLEVLVLGPVELGDLDDIGVDGSVGFLEMASIASGGELRANFIFLASAVLLGLEVDALLLASAHGLPARIPFFCIVDLALLLCGTAQSLVLSGYPSLYHLLHCDSN